MFGGKRWRVAARVGRWWLRGWEGWGRRPVGRRADAQGGGASGEGRQRLGEELCVPPGRGGVFGDGQAMWQRLVVVGIGVGVLLLPATQSGRF